MRSSDGDSTYGPKANFKISLRELPDYGRFRVTVTAAKYNDGLLLDPGAAGRRLTESGRHRSRDPKTPQTVTIPKAGHLPGRRLRAAAKQAPARRTCRGSAMGLPDPGRWMATCGDGRVWRERRKFVDSPFGKAVSLDGDGDSVVIPRTMR